MRQTIFYPAPFATKVAQNTNHHFGRPIQNRRACLRPLPARASCAPGPGLTDRRSPRDGKAALAGSAACQERVCTVISPSRASLDPSRVVLQQPRANLSILDWEYTYGLLIPRWVGPGNTNLTAAACVQQAVYRFCRGLCTSFQRRTRPCATIGLFRHGPRDVAKRSPPLSLCKSDLSGVHRQWARSLSPNGLRYFERESFVRASRVRSRHVFTANSSAAGTAESERLATIRAKPTSVDLLDAERGTQNYGKWTSRGPIWVRFKSGLTAAKAAVASSSRERDPLPSPALPSFVVVSR